MLELGRIELLAAELGVSVGTARRLVRRGPPSRWGEAQLLAYANALYLRAHVIETTRDEAVRVALERKRRAPVYSDEARQGAVRSLGLALDDLERRRPCERGTWSPRAELGRQLLVSSARIGRWMAAGRVPQEFMGRVMSWAQARAEEKMRRQEEQGHVERLIEQAKVPVYVHTLPGAPRKFGARAPDIVSQEGPLDYEETSGYHWALRVEDWSTFERIDLWTAWAASRRRPPGMRAPGRYWLVTALCTLYHPEGRRTGKRKSPGAKRQFESPADRARGQNMSIGAPISSYLVKTGGLERAARLFHANLLEEHCELDQIYVHAITVRNWRNRSSIERRNYRRRVSARVANEKALAKREKETAAAIRREAARQRALGRRGSAAATASKAKPRPAGARPSGKKRT